MLFLEPATRRKMASECFGTFCLVFAGTGAIVINQISGGAITHPGVALTFGLVVMAMIYALGDVSGAHLNPAVTLGLRAAGLFEKQLVLPYLICQLTGAVLASLTLRLLFPDSTDLGATQPSGGLMQSTVLEFLLTLILMFTIFAFAKRPGAASPLAGIVIGGVIALEALFAGPICGASMNPARSLAPAVVAMAPQHLWIYLAGPLAGALMAVPLSALIHGKPVPTQQ
ncbi:MAG: aquaporin [Gemmataceae bacterium]|nr:aquaporin [Gemmataceae bacterium]